MQNFYETETEFTGAQRSAFICIKFTQDVALEGKRYGHFFNEMV